jgi:hypothetical protein
MLGNKVKEHTTMTDELDHALQARVDHLDTEICKALGLEHGTFVTPLDQIAALEAVMRVLQTLLANMPEDWSRTAVDNIRKKLRSRVAERRAAIENMDEYRPTLGNA